METFGDKYNIGPRVARYEFGKYRGADVEYTVPETGEVRSVFVPSGSSLIASIGDDLKK